MVSTRTSLWAEQSKTDHSKGKRFSSPPDCPDQLRDPPSLPFNAYQGTFLALKWPEHEVNHSPPPTITVKTEDRCTSTPLTWPHSVDMNNFTLTIILHTSSVLQTRDSM
jgi:hypothetical protein